MMTKAQKLMELSKLKNDPLSASDRFEIIESLFGEDINEIALAGALICNLSDSVENLHFIPNETIMSMLSGCNERLLSEAIWQNFRYLQSTSVIMKSGRSLISIVCQKDDRVIIEAFEGLSTAEKKAIQKGFHPDFFSIYDKFPADECHHFVEKFRE